MTTIIETSDDEIIKVKRTDTVSMLTDAILKAHPLRHFEDAQDQATALILARDNALSPLPEIDRKHREHTDLVYAIEAANPDLSFAQCQDEATLRLRAGRQDAAGELLLNLHDGGE
jgi:hypothetical protein